MADQRIQHSEQMVGAGHPTKSDTLNRFALIEHNTDGTHNKLTKVTDPYRDPRADGAVGNGSTSDKAALDLTFANPVIQIPEGTWMGYNLSLDTVNKLSGMGQGSIIKCNSLAADFTVGFQDYPTPTGRTKLTITDLVIDGNKALGTYTGMGHGLDLRGYDEVYIDRLEVKNAFGHGVIIGNCAKVRIGTLVAHDCDKYGVVFDANLGVGFAEEITIDTLISYSNGGSTYSGINFSDITTTPAGSRKISIGKVYTFSNGRTGIAFGRNATATTTGPSDITVGEIHSYGNGNLGVELFGCSNVTIGSINTYSNTYAGVGIYHGDLNSPTYDYALAENISIGQIITHNNALDGVDIMGAFKLEIGSIIAYNNSIGNTNQYSGVRLRANNPGSNANYNKDIHIGSILAYDNQGTPTQKYGLARESAVHGGHVSIGHLRAYGNATVDVADAVSEANYVDPLTIGSWDVGTALPTYSTNIDGAGVRHTPFKVGELYYGAGQTTGNTIASLVRIPVPSSKVSTVHAYIQAATNSTLANQASYERIVTILNNGTNVTLVGAITDAHTAESDAGMDVTIIGGSPSTYITVRVTGVAATTINWKAMVRVVEH